MINNNKHYLFYYFICFLNFFWNKIFILNFIIHNKIFFFSISIHKNRMFIGSVGNWYKLSLKFWWDDYSYTTFFGVPTSVLMPLHFTYLNLKYLWVMTITCSYIIYINYKHLIKIRFLHNIEILRKIFRFGLWT